MRDGQSVINVLGISAAALTYVVIVAVGAALSFALVDSGPVSGIFLMYALPLLQTCLAAGAAGAVLSFCLRTDHPAFYGMVLGGLLLLYRWTSMTVFWENARWQDVAWIVTDLLVPAFVAFAVTYWLYRNRVTTTRLRR